MKKKASPEFGFGLIIERWLRDQPKLAFLDTCCCGDDRIFFTLRGDGYHIAQIALDGDYLYRPSNYSSSVEPYHRWRGPIKLHISDPKFFEKFHEQLVQLWEL